MKMCRLIYRAAWLCLGCLTTQTVVRVTLDTSLPSKSEALLMPLLHLFSSAKGRALVPAISILRMIIVSESAVFAADM
jgi:hypothetical protein